MRIARTGRRNVYCSCDYYRVYTVPRFRGQTQGGGSDPSCRISLTCVYTVILLTEQTPQEGQNEWAQVWIVVCYTWKNSIHCGCRPGFLFTPKKVRCRQTPHAGSNPTNLEECKRRVRPRNRGRRFAFTLRGKRRGLTRIWGSTPQSEYCVNAVYVHTNCVQSLHDSPVHIIILCMSTGKCQEATQHCQSEQICAHFCECVHVNNDKNCGSCKTVLCAQRIIADYLFIFWLCQWFNKTYNKKKKKK